MNVSVDKLKQEFAELKYAQLLHDKYFVETCFSKKFESIKSSNLLLELLSQITVDCSVSHETITEC